MTSSRHLALVARATAVVSLCSIAAASPTRSLGGAPGVDGAARAAALAADVAHWVADDGRGHVAHNPGQAWSTRFDGRGALTTPRAGAWSWGLELRSFGWEGCALELAPEPAVAATEGRLAYRHHELVDEWYVNDTRGLEHGFDVRARPVDATGRLELVLAVRGDLAPLVDASGRNVAFLDTRGAAVLRYDGLVAFDARGTLLDARFTGEGAALRLVVDDRAAQYPITIDPIAQQAFLKASNPGQFDGFGQSLDLSGDTLVVGAPNEDSGATGVGGNQNDESQSNAGAAYVFVRGPQGWSQQAYLKAADTTAARGISPGGDAFGTSVAIDGDTIVVGAPFDDSGVVGDPTDNALGNAGAAYVFERVGGTWVQTGYLKSPAPGSDERLGTSVAVAGDTIVAGAPGANLTPGSAQVFVQSGGVWSHQAELVQSFGQVDDAFGASVAIDGDTVVVGTPSDNSSATGVNGNPIPYSASGSGAAYVFVRTASTWTQEAYVKASNTEIADNFGSAVAIQGDLLAIAAPNEDSAATGIGGNQASNAASNSGAVYLFERTGTNWAQVAYVKASNTNAGDAFGASLALSPQHLLVGASSERSNATGLSGNQLDNSLSFAGAAYLFARTGSSVAQVAYVKSTWSAESGLFGSAAALDGSAFVVGESGSARDASGANGGPALLGSGGVFVYDLETVTTKLGCTGNQGQLTTDDLGLYLGTPFDLDFTTTLPAGVAVLAYGTDGTNFIGCGAFVPGLGEVLLGLVNTPTILAIAPVVGSITFTVPVPPNPSLAGIQIGFQAFALDGLGGSEASNLLLDRLSL
jgi:hypothetical protein